MIKASCKSSRNRDASTERPNQASPGPCHALEKATSVDAIVIKVLHLLINQILFVIPHFASPFAAFRVDNWREPHLFQEFARSGRGGKKVCSGITSAR